MKIEKLPSGSYRIRKMYKGQAYTVVTDYNPTQKEALKLMADELDRVKTDNTNHRHLTFLKAAEDYIDAKRNVLSPSTIAGYGRISKAISEQLKHKAMSYSNPRPSFGFDYNVDK